MKKIIIFYFILFAVFAIESIAVNVNTATQEDSGGTYSVLCYSPAEMTEIAKILIVLEGASEEELRKRMDALPIFHKVLLGS